MTKDEIIKLGLTVLGRGTDDFMTFARHASRDEWVIASEVASKKLQLAEKAVLETVRKDECDFVLMSHYRQAYDLYQECTKKVRGGSDDSGS